MVSEQFINDDGGGTDQAQISFTVKSFIDLIHTLFHDHTEYFIFTFEVMIEPSVGHPALSNNFVQRCFFAAQL
ncbi:hypothetical protein D3C81_2184070 [compost metagenome]